MEESSAVPVYGETLRIFLLGHCEAAFLSFPSRATWLRAGQKTQVELMEDRVHKNLPHNLPLFFFCVCGPKQRIPGSSQCCRAGLSKLFQ